MSLEQIYDTSVTAGDESVPWKGQTQTELGQSVYINSKMAEDVKDQYWI